MKMKMTKTERERRRLLKERMNELHVITLMEAITTRGKSLFHECVGLYSAVSNTKDYGVSIDTLDQYGEHAHELLHILNMVGRAMGEIKGINPHLSRLKALAAKSKRKLQREVEKLKS